MGAPIVRSVIVHRPIGRDYFSRHTFTLHTFDRIISDARPGTGDRKRLLRHNPQMTRVLIVDDHPLVARATANEVRMLKPEAETHIAGSVEAAERVLADWQPLDVILLDLRLPDTDGLSGLTRLHRLAPKAAIAIVSAETDPQVMRDAFVQGARGYLTKSTDIDRFTESLRKVLDYGFYFPPEATEPAPPIHRSRLTDREAEVIKALASGKVNKQLADMLGVSESTFKTHLRAIYRKLGVRTRVQAAGRARELGLVAGRSRA